MRTLLALIFLILISISANGQVQEKYFHDLRGLEDSTGITHLFYRIYSSKSISCTTFDGYNGNSSIIDNSVYHFNRTTLTDSVRFKDNVTPILDCDTNAHFVLNYLFPKQDPDSAVLIVSNLSGLSGGTYIYNNPESTFFMGTVNPAGISFDQFQEKVILNTPIQNIVVKSQGRNFDEGIRKSFRFTPEDSTWTGYDGFHRLPDSLLIDFTVTGIDPVQKGRYIGFTDSNVVLSSDYGDSFSAISAIPFENYEFYAYRNIKTTWFDTDSSSFYMNFQYNQYPKNQLWDDIYLFKKKDSAWTVSEILDQNQHSVFTINDSESGQFYFSISDSLMLGDQFGATSELIDEFPFQISGLYKKPDSELLYVLTIDELFELNVESGTKTSLKTLPVSNEPEPTDTPKKVVLQQNYPNPFNPSTLIRYQLPVSSEVSLKVYDMLGREVFVLVDGKVNAGNHEITFNADGLSSGVYFYRLESDDFIETKQFTLIK